MSAPEIFLPFGLILSPTPYGYVIASSNLERELYVSDDNLGSKSEAARIAMEQLLLSLADADVFLTSHEVKAAIAAAVPRAARQL